MKTVHLREQIDDEEFRKLKKNYPHSKWADLADWDMLDNKVCGDWQGSTKCPEKESEMYEKYAQEHPESPRAPEALYNAVYRQGGVEQHVLRQWRRQKGRRGRGKSRNHRRYHCHQISPINYAARAASLVYQLQESIPIYGADRQ